MPITINGSGSISGFNQIDPPTFVVDETNNRVGIGTTSPSTTLDVFGNSTVRDTINFRSVSAPSGDRWTNIGNYSDGNFVIARHNDDGSYRANIIVGWNNDEVSISSGSTGIERMRIDSSGRVTRPFQVAFSGHTGSFSSTVTGGANHTSGINYGNNVVLAQTINVGGHWNLTTGRFTAPISGRYVFGVNGHKDANTAARDAIASLSVNGSYYEIVEVFGNYADAGGTILLNLSANDWVEAGRNNAFTNMNRITFWGYLLG